ncbi:MAG: hypothetical protein R3Y06_07045 [Faecalibacterium sp.]
MYHKLCEDLLTEWCEQMLALQITDKTNEGLYGGILCPACSRVDGRCMDALYPFLYMADKTKDEKWVEAAKLLFIWTENAVSRPDGRFLNGTNNLWSGITVFSVVQLCEALKYHGHILDDETVGLWKARIHKAAEFLLGFGPVYHHNVNYRFTNTVAMQLCGDLFGDARYYACAKKCADQAKEYLTENMLLFGEGVPPEGVTPRGCRAVDIGYNVEESLPSLANYAHMTHDSALETLVAKAMAAQLQFMLPDGGWDNSFGSRSFKWTYWGSRTSDGCAFGYALMAHHDPAFLTAAQRTLEILQHCTHGGLLMGGLEYHTIGERPCVHHTFSHAKVLAALLDHNIVLDGQGAPLPRAQLPAVVNFPEIDTALLRADKLLATYTCYDWEYLKGGHPSGGNISMLWHPAAGVVLAGTMSEYSLHEPNNQQIPRFERHECLTPRLEYTEGETWYTTLYDFAAQSTIATDGAITVQGQVADITHHAPAQPLHHSTQYTLRENSLQVALCLQGEHMAQSQFVCPLVSAEDEAVVLGEHSVVVQKAHAILTLTVQKGKLSLPYGAARCYNLVGGLQALKVCVAPQDGEISFLISIQEKA